MSFNELRALAEESLNQIVNDPVNDLPPAGLHALVRELRITNIAYQMRNRELCEERDDEYAELARYLELYDNAPVGYFTLDEGGCISEMNITGARQLGVEREDLLQRKFEAIVDPEFLERFRQHCRDVCTDDRDAYIEILLIKVDGSSFLARLDCRPEKIDGSATGRVWIAVIDIAEREKSQRELRESEERFRTIFNRSFAGIIVVDSEGKLLRVNPAFQRMLGYTEKELNIALQSITAPDDIEKSQKYFQELMRGKIDHFELEQRFLKKNGEVLWVHLSVAPARADDGGFLYSLAIVEDITKRKNAVSALQESERKYKALIETTDTGFVVIDDAGRVLDANNKYIKLTGRSGQADVIGNYEMEWIVQNERTIYREKLRECSQKGVIRNYETEFVSPDNVVIPVEFNMTLMTTEHGKRYIALVRNITQRKHLEKQLRAASITDEMTGLLNRRGFFTFMRQQCMSALRTKNRMALLYIDLDSLKIINDRLGHKEGDRALKDVADIIKATFRASDIVSRLGGDEFAVLLTEIVEPEIEYRIMNLIKYKLQVFNETSGRAYNLSVSLGISYYNPESPESIDDLISLADAEMYKDKRAHKRDCHEPDTIKERRTHERIKPGVKCFVEGIHTAEHCTVQDISAGGVLVRSCGQLSTDQLVKGLSIRVNEHRYLTDGIVVRSARHISADGQTSGPEYYATAIRFVGLNDTCQASLCKILDTLSI